MKTKVDYAKEILSGLSIEIDRYQEDYTIPELVRILDEYAGQSKIYSSPMNARTSAKISKLETDSYNTEDYLMLTSETEVTIWRQRSDEDPQGVMSIPKRDFNLLIRWYQKPQGDKGKHNE